MALAFLLLVFLVVVALITLFVFPPNKWVQWFYGQDKKADQD
jgi:antibiotic biosynthesis monooxygenase (ABM) superfamily enzyme